MALMLSSFTTVLAPRASASKTLAPINSFHPSIPLNHTTPVLYQPTNHTSPYRLNVADHTVMSIDTLPTSEPSYDYCFFGDTEGYSVTTMTSTLEIDYSYIMTFNQHFPTWFSTALCSYNYNPDTAQGELCEIGIYIAEDNNIWLYETYMNYGDGAHSEWFNIPDWVVYYPITFYMWQSSQYTWSYRAVCNGYTFNNLPDHNYGQPLSISYYACETENIRMNIMDYSSSITTYSDVLYVMNWQTAYDADFSSYGGGQAGIGYYYSGNYAQSFYDAGNNWNIESFVGGADCPGAGIFVDGNYVGTTTASIYIVPGYHDISIDYDYYGTCYAESYIDSGWIDEGYSVYNQYADGSCHNLEFYCYYGK
jgi:hypothetical protein